MNKSKDFIYSVLSNVMIMVLMQFLLLPIYSKSHSTIEFGNFILLLTLVNMISPIIGNTLNNIRLINKNKDQIIESEYLFLIFMGSVIVMCVTGLYSLVNQFAFIDIMFSSLWSAFLLIRCYLFVYYRLDFRFKSLFYISLVASAIMIIGGVSMYLLHTSVFVILFLSEFLMSILMIFEYKNVLKKTNIKMLNKVDFKSYLELLSANSILNLINYSDRILLSIFLGTIYVPLFFIATIIGKISNILINPIVTVLLSYEVDNKQEITTAQVRKTWKLIIFLSIIISIFISVLSWVFIYIFYNEYIYKVQLLIFPASLGVILMSSSALLQIKLLANN
ncbi:capsular biosynthesis protein, partial [Staphylococcus arlettae]